MSTPNAQSPHSDVCSYCLEVHAFASAVENFELDRGFSIYDLPMHAETSDARVYWGTITLETKFETAYGYLMSVAADYLQDGTVECYCR